MLGIGSSVTEFYSGFGGRFSPSRGYFIGYGTNEKKAETLAEVMKTVAVLRFKYLIYMMNDDIQSVQ